MPARHFTAASSEFITLSIGALGFAFGPGTIAAIVQPASSAATSSIFSAGLNNTSGCRMQINSTAQLALALNATVVTSTTTYSANKWYLFAVTKATGTVTPVMHIYDFVTNTWTHENASGTSVNGTAPSGNAYIGAPQAHATAFMGGDIAMCGCWNVVLSNSQVEELAYHLNGWFSPATPKGLWVLDQDAVAQKLGDLSGGGANQSAITGTSLGTSSVPVFSRGARFA